MIGRHGIAFMIAAFGFAPALAEAADLGPYRPPAPQPEYDAPPADYAPPRYNWSGLYLGINGGYGWGESTQSFNDVELSTTNPEGVMGAVTLGYNWHTPGGLLFGLEGDIGLMDTSDEDDNGYKYGPWWGTVRGRAGIAFDRTLFYATAGVAFMDVDEVSIGGTADETAWHENIDTGWTVGGGIEHALTSNLSLKVEYLHMDFGDYEGYSASSDSFSFDNNVDVVRAGLNFKF